MLSAIARETETGKVGEMNERHQEGWRTEKRKTNHKKKEHRRSMKGWKQYLVR
jgi:hypothetical protein